MLAKLQNLAKGRTTLFTAFKDLYAAAFGRRYLKTVQKQDAAALKPLLASIDLLNHRFTFPKFEARDDGATPIFLLASSWRSGSTFLQRLISSDEDTLIWGEPFGDTGLINSLSEPLTRITENRPPDSFFLPPGDEALSLQDSWIANLYPSVDDLRCAYREMLDRLLLEPVRRKKLLKWGMKEVRLDAGHATFLKWIYPSAKIVFLVRNPLDAYRSYSHDKSWYDIRPERPIHTARDFARHWNRLSSSYVENVEYLNALLIRYEDLKKDTPSVCQLEEFLGVEVNSDVFSDVLRGSSGLEKRSNDFLRGEATIIKAITSHTGSKLGYRL